MSELKPCPSPIENAITVLENEKQCVLRQIKVGGCDRNCAKCDLVMKDSKILAGYDTAIAVLRLAQPDHSGDATEMPANADRIRSLSDEELAEYIFDLGNGSEYCYGHCAYQHNCTTRGLDHDTCIKGVLDWLQQKEEV